MENNRVILGGGGNTLKEAESTNPVQGLSETIGFYIINSLSDLPAPVNDVITLSEDGATYTLADGLNWGVTRLHITGQGVTLKGANVNKSVQVSSTTGTFVTCDASVFLKNITLVSAVAGSYGIYAEDSVTDTITIETCAVIGFTTQIYIKDYKSLIVRLLGLDTCTDGIVLEGHMAYTEINNVLGENITGTQFDFENCTIDTIDILSNICDATATTTFLRIAPNNGNIVGDGYGTIIANKIVGDIAGVGSVGYSPLDLQWEAIGNTRIIDSDRISPAGWGYYVDDALVDVVAGSGVGNEAKLTINGLAGTSNSAYLPKVIRGTSEIFDTSTSEILSITEGDSYVMRVAFTIDNTSGNPQRINLILDIGGTGNISIPIANYSSTLKTGTPQSHTFTIPYFTLSTFLANKGQLFVYCDSGTADITNRSVLIERASSGAS